MSVKVIALLKARPGLSRAQFLRLWQAEHPAIVGTLPGLRGYRQNPAIEHRKEWPYDGLAELFFDSVDDVRLAFASPEAGPLRDHEEYFLEHIDWFLASETTVEPVPPSC